MRPIILLGALLATMLMTLALPAIAQDAAPPGAKGRFDRYVCDQIKTQHQAYMKAASVYVFAVPAFLRAFHDLPDEVQNRLGLSEDNDPYLRGTATLLGQDQAFRTAAFICAKFQPIDLARCNQLRQLIQQTQAYVAPARPRLAQAGGALPLLPIDSPFRPPFEKSHAQVTGTLTAMTSALTELDGIIRNSCRVQGFMVP